MIVRQAANIDFNFSPFLTGKFATTYAGFQVFSVQVSPVLIAAVQALAAYCGKRSK